MEFSEIQVLEKSWNLILSYVGQLKWIMLYSIVHFHGHNFVFVYAVH